jgi:sulfotransferase
MKRFNMIAGLPRSGSTLLTSILNQNPKFYSGIVDSLCDVLAASVRVFSIPGSHTQSTDEQKINAMSAFIEGYYQHVDAEVVFNTSRIWTSYLPLIYSLRPNAKIICCVRDIPWILDSFEVLFMKNPTLHSSSILGYIAPEDSHTHNIYARAHRAMNDNNGVIARFLHSMKQGYYSPYGKNIIFVEYEDLARKPEQTMRKIYNFIEEPYYNHNFDAVEASYDEFDAAVQLKGMHKIRRKVEFIERPTVLPPDLWDSCSKQEFWREFTYK